MPGTKWFSGARLNFAENLLRFRDDRTAIVFRGEDQVRRQLSYAQLFAEVSAVAAALKSLGVTSGDRVAGFMPNMPETIIAMLAASSLGATWSSCSPDFGIKGVLDRFGQIKPRVLFTADGYFFKGKKIDSLERVERILEQIDSVEKVVVIPYTQAEPNLNGIKNGILFEEFKVPIRRPWSSSSCPLTIRCTSCTPPEPQGCPNVWCKAPGAFSCIK
jgi:acetoacetyl-CoA synthetase